MTDKAVADIPDPDVTALRRGFGGQILLGGADDYEQARRVMNSMVARRPMMIARCSGPRDVAAAVRFARKKALEIGIRGGRHGVFGLAVPEGGLMVDQSLIGVVESTRIDVAQGSREARCSGHSTKPHRLMVWPPPPGTSRTRASED